MMRTALLRNAIGYHKRWFSISPQNQGSTSILRDTPRRCFSTDEPAEPPKEDSIVDSFLETPATDSVYARLFGITRNTTKSDILNLFDKCKLSPDDVKVNYSRSYAPSFMMIQFSSGSSFDTALRANNRSGRFYRIERCSRSQWDAVAPFNGKAVLLQGIPRNALFDDVERFLSGCEYDASSVEMFTRQGFPEPIRMALVRFHSQADAIQAYITKNRGFCLNTQILVRLLQ